MEEHHTMLDVEAVTFDAENPRIKMALEKYGGQLDEARMHFALRSATDGTKRTSSYNSLKDSILASKGATVPITVITKDDKYVCIDGNTRLAIYKQLAKEQENGLWKKIKAVVLDNSDQRDVETVRVSAHLIGSREWPAYEKARYLHYLHNQKFMSYGEMIALCGGNKPDIERQIDAYNDMNEYYRDVVDDTEFHIDRFSGFVELQNSRIKEAIFGAGLDIKDFGKWIRDGKIYRLDSVRHLPKVLHDDEARKVFLEGGIRSIEDAVKVLDQRIEKKADKSGDNVTLERASLHHLAETLARRISSLPYAEMRALRDREHEEAAEQVSVLEHLSAQLNKLLEDVSE